MEPAPPNDDELVTREPLGNGTRSAGKSFEIFTSAGNFVFAVGVDPESPEPDESLLGVDVFLALLPLLVLVLEPPLDGVLSLGELSLDEPAGLSPTVATMVVLPLAFVTLV